ncbi:MAG: hypothetical protein VSS75_001615 [Candidatus Parabeggiatoa sp.]|nr:hypothetical protein [Candidatus Parabeggiatoa sp.]
MKAQVRNDKTNHCLAFPLGYKQTTGITAGVDLNYTCLKADSCADVMLHLNNIENKIAQLYACMTKKAC